MKILELPIADLEALLNRETATLAQAKQRHESEKTIADIQGNIDKLTKIIESKQLKDELDAIEIPQTPPKSPPLLSGTLTPKAAKNTVEKSPKVQRIKRDYYFNSANDRKLYRHRVTTLQVKILNWTKLKKKEENRIEYRNKIEKLVESVIDFINKRARNEWKDYLMNEKTYSVCDKDKSRFKINFESIIKQFEI